MNIRKILFPTDFSPLSDGALEFATSLARDHSATLLIAHVIDPPEAVRAMASHSAAAAQTSVAQSSVAQSSQLKKVVPTDLSVAYEHRLLDGAPSRALVQLAKDEAVDLIVMATHGHSGLTRLLMGSVAEAVVRRAPCPVLTVSAAVAEQAQDERGLNGAQTRAEAASPTRQSSPRQTATNESQSAAEKSSRTPAEPETVKPEVKRDAADWAATEIHEAKQPHGVKHDDDLGTYRG